MALPVAVMVAALVLEELALRAVQALGTAMRLATSVNAANCD